MSNVKWGSSVVPQYNTPTYGKKKQDESVQTKGTGVRGATQNVANTVKSTGSKISSALGTLSQNQGAKSVPVPMNPATNGDFDPYGGVSWDSTDKVLGEAADAESASKAMPQWNTNANFGIRNSLENDFAIDGSRIGYKDGNVLLDGKFLMKADNNVDGTTYAKDYATVAGKVNDYIKNNGLVAIRDYAASSGTAVNVQWNDAEKTVSINGRTVVPTAVVDGKAYIPKSQLDAILTSERSTAGTSYNNIYNEVQDKYGKDVDSMYNKYINGEEFNYVPENDPAYQAYMKTAQKAINDEYAENLAASRFRTGGVGSTGQMLQAAAIREGAVEDIAAARAQFEQNAYQRYMDEQALNRDRFEVAHGRQVDEYNLRAGVNAADKQDFYYGQTFDRTMQATDEDLKYMYFSNGLDYKYMPGYAEMEYGDAVRNYNISEEFAPILAELEVGNDILQYVTDRESLIMALQKAGRTPEYINSIMAEIDAFSTYING